MCFTLHMDSSKYGFGKVHFLFFHLPNSSRYGFVGHFKQSVTATVAAVSTDSIQLCQSKDIMPVVKKKFVYMYSAFGK
jgi:hypothetical protein